MKCGGSIDGFLADVHIINMEEGSDGKEEEGATKLVGEGKACDDVKRRGGKEEEEDALMEEKEADDDDKETGCISRIVIWSSVQIIG